MDSVISNTFLSLPRGTWFI